MTAFRRGGSFVVFQWSGDMPSPDDGQEFVGLLAEHRFRTIELAASEETSVGWVTRVDPTGDAFVLEELDAGPACWLRMRVDEKKLAKELLERHIAIAEKARGRRLSKKDRRQLKEDLIESTLPKQVPTTRNYDALLFRSAGVVLLFSTSKKVRELFAKLFVETFGVDGLDLVDPLLMVRHGGSGVLHDDAKSLEPTRWPVASNGGSPTQQTLAIDNTFGFLGEEFLLWLWHRWETEGGEFMLPRDVVVGVSFDDLLVFSEHAVDGTKQTLRGGMPTRTAEALAALRQGHRLAKAKLIVAEASRMWTLTLDGEKMQFSGVKLPEDAEELESSEDRTADRAANWLRIFDVVTALFVRFVRDRVSSSWLLKAGEIAGWMRR